jgi:hypothetical protein
MPKAKNKAKLNRFDNLVVKMGEGMEGSGETTSKGQQKWACRRER